MSSRVEHGQRGKLIPTHNNLFLIYNKASEPMFFANIVKDITEQKKAEEALINKNEELKTFNDIAVGRELVMVNMKKEINDLCERLGEKPKYNTNFERS